MTNNQTANYVMGKTREEYQRLRQQAQVLERFTVSVLDRIGLSQGAHCLDVGCGPGEVMRVMAERVGKTGRVVGLDLDGDLGREGLSVLHDLGHTQCSFVEGDLQSPAKSESNRFDLVYGRLV